MAHRHRQGLDRVCEGRDVGSLRGGATIGAAAVPITARSRLHGRCMEWGWRCSRCRGGRGRCITTAVPPPSGTIRRGCDAVVPDQSNTEVCMNSMRTVHCTAAALQGPGRANYDTAAGLRVTAQQWLLRTFATAPCGAVMRCDHRGEQLHLLRHPCTQHRPPRA